jgi:hypothetical protein
MHGWSKKSTGVHTPGFAVVLAVVLYAAAVDVHWRQQALC